MGNAGGQRGIKGRKKWDNCNSIINKMYLKKNKNITKGKKMKRDEEEQHSKKKEE